MRAAGLPSGPLRKEIAPFLRQHDMAGLATLARAHAQRAGIGVEVVDRHRGQLAIAAAGQQRGRDQRAEIGRAGIRQPQRFVIREIAELGRIGFTERAHGAPSVIARAFAFAVRMVERGLQDRQHPVRSRAAPAHGFGAVMAPGASAPRRAWCAAGRASRQSSDATRQCAPCSASPARQRRARA